ncbi:MAG: carotenoid oxygenase family protein, partial [Candidatus Binataceae bacterium]
AHAKADPVSGELCFFDYATREPFMTYNVAVNGKLKHHAPIELPGARLPHDMAITRNYSLLMDLPLFWDPELLRRNLHKVRYYPELPSRFGIIPRYGSNADVRWFEASPCYIYHVINAWEEGAELVMDACRVVEPAPNRSNQEELARMRAFLRLEAQVWRWRFDLNDGGVKEEQLDDDRTEWPSINRSLTGQPTRYSYNSLVPHYEGLVKYDNERRRTERYLFGCGRTANEAPFAPRHGATAEDDGYLVTFVADSATYDAGEVVVLDARNVGDGPLARIKIPQRVPSGFHATWIPGEQLR